MHTIKHCIPLQMGGLGDHVSLARQVRVGLPDSVNPSRQAYMTLSLFCMGVEFSTNGIGPQSGITVIVQDDMSHLYSSLSHILCRIPVKNTTDYKIQITI